MKKQIVNFALELHYNLAQLLQLDLIIQGLLLCLGCSLLELLDLIFERPVFMAKPVQRVNNAVDFLAEQAAFDLVSVVDFWQRGM